jgi:LmbE family N-acetylglucosaminyl deacetylase
MKTLVIAAHPDDETLMCGGSIAGTGAHVIVCSTGVTSRGDIAHMSLHEDLLAACKVLGVTVEHHFLPDQRFDALDILDVTQRMERFIDQHKPEVIYTHHPADVNRDHRIVFEAVLTATRMWKGSLYACEVPGSVEWAHGSCGDFRPNTFTMLSLDRLGAKVEAMNCYRGESREWPHPRSVRGITVRAERWGSVIGAPYAEAFQLIKAVT